MTRRSFIDAALKAAAGFAILPGATTYARRWKPTASGVVVPTWLPYLVVRWDEFERTYNPASNLRPAWAFCNGAFDAVAWVKAQEQLGLPKPL